MEQKLTWHPFLSPTHNLRWNIKYYDYAPDGLLFHINVKYQVPRTLDKGLTKGRENRIPTLEDEATSFLLLLSFYSLPTLSRRAEMK